MEEPGDVGSLEGFAKVEIDFEGFYIPEHAGKPNGMRGILLGKQTLSADPNAKTEDAKKGRSGFIVRLTHPCWVSVGRGEDAHEEIAKKGQLIFVGEKKKTEMFSVFTPRQTADGRTKAYEVAFIPGKKIKIGGGKTMWTGSPHARELSGEECKTLGLVQVAQLQTEQKVRQLAAANEVTSEGEEEPWAP